VERMTANMQNTPLTLKTTIVQEIPIDPRELVQQLKDELELLKRECESLRAQQEKTNRKVSIGYAAGESIYLAQTRDCFDKDNNVFKIGRTTKYEQRKKGYPKGTIFFLQRLCLKSIEMERTILSKAKALFKNRTDYGNEYFEGDLRSMIDLINSEVNVEEAKPE